jgi:hypothetical protein
LARWWCTSGPLAGKEITLSSLWKDLAPAITKHPSYTIFIALTTQRSGTTPLDLFKLRVRELQEAAHRDKRRLRDICREFKYEVGSTTTLEEMHDAIKEHPSYPDIPSEHIKLSHSVFVVEAAEREAAKAKRDEREQEREAQREEVAFKDWLNNHLAKFTKETPFEDIGAMVAEKEGLPAAEKQAELYAEFVAKDPWSRPAAESSTHRGSSSRRDDGGSSSKPRHRRRSRSRSPRGGGGRSRSRSPRGRSRARSRQRSKSRDRRRSPKSRSRSRSRSPKRKAKKRKKEKKGKSKKKSSSSKSHKKRRHDDSSGSESNESEDDTEEAALEAQKRELLRKLQEASE